MFQQMEVPELQQIPSIDTDDGRYYKSPNGKWLPSITTILGHFNKDIIDDWRKRVGDTAANNISRIAAERGTIIHGLAESYLKNEQLNMLRMRPDHKAMFLNLRKELDNISDIQYIEAQLWSEQLGTAGRCDLVAKYKQTSAIVDFKTSRKDKKEDWIQHYFEQGTGYSVMLEERTGIAIETVVIIIVNDNQYSDNPVQVFSINRSDYLDSLKEKIKQYHREKGTSYEQRLNQHLCHERIDGISIPESYVSTS